MPGRGIQIQIRIQIYTGQDEEYGLDICGPGTQGGCQDIKDLPKASAHKVKCREKHFTFFGHFMPVIFHA